MGDEHIVWIALDPFLDNNGSQNEPLKLPNGSWDVWPKCQVEQTRISGGGGGGRLLYISLFIYDKHIFCLISSSKDEYDRYH